MPDQILDATNITFSQLTLRNKKKYNLGPHRYGQNAIDVDWGIVVMLALAGKVTRRNLIQRIKPPEFNKNSKMFGLHSFFLVEVFSYLVAETKD
jgi:hypothetical protein